MEAERFFIYAFPKISGDVDDIYVSDVLLKQRWLGTDGPIRKIHNDSHYIYTLIVGKVGAATFNAYEVGR